MVGDAQIGKTSLMVKYVEGTFDEDYIQTLGKFSNVVYSCHDVNIIIAHRCKFYGENCQHKECKYYVLYLGSWRSTRIHKYAAVGL